jgi:hypothetical protein
MPIPYFSGSLDLALRPYLPVPDLILANPSVQTQSESARQSQTPAIRFLPSVCWYAPSFLGLGTLRHRIEIINE